VTESADTEDRREDRIPINFNQPIVLEVHNPDGAVTVRAAERTDVLVRHATTGDGGDLGDEEIDLKIDAHQNRIEVRVNSGAGSGWAGITGDVDLDAVVGQITRAFRRGGPWSSVKMGKARVAGGRHAWSDITVEVPQAITGRIRIHTTSGDVRIEDVTGEIALSSMSGEVRAVRTSGELTLQTASGDLIVDAATGRLTAQTASGNLNIASVQTGVFDIKTVSGDILLDAMLAGDGPFRAHTVSGDVRLTLRQSTAGGEEPVASLAFQTVSGDANVTQPFRKTDRRLWQVGSGDRGPRVDVKTVSGDLVARFDATESAFVPSTPASPADGVRPVPSAPPTPATPPAPLIAPAPLVSATETAPLTVAVPPGEPDFAAVSVGPEEAQPAVQEDAVRLAVLEAVERGEIDVEEALRRLEAVDSIPGA
jgi:DUF4097 and DUF4098 domain-containing protein YvlB